MNRLSDDSGIASEAAPSEIIAQNDRAFAATPALFRHEVLPEGELYAQHWGQIRCEADASDRFLRHFTKENEAGIPALSDSLETTKMIPLWNAWLLRGELRHQAFGLCENPPAVRLSMFCNLPVFFFTHRSSHILRERMVKAS
jgi:hypothetical protein